MLRLSVITSLVLLITCSAFTQIYFFKKYDTSSGLIQNTIRVIHQDRHGRLWIATAEGLNIYDGENFINCSFKTEPDNNIITCFFELNDSIMLAGTSKKGIFVFLKTPYGEDILLKTFSGKKYLISDNVSSIIKDWRNSYWICTDSGLTKWTMPEQKSSETSFNKINVKHFGIDSKELPGRYIQATINLKNKKLWFYSDRGLFSSDGNNFILEMKPLPNRVNKIFIDGDSLFITSSNQILIYKNGSIKKFYELPENYIASEIIKDSKGIFWFATTKGILKYDGRDFSIIDRNNGLEEHFIISLMEDRERNIWIGSINGLYKYSRDTFNFLKGSEKLPHILSFKVDRAGIPWLSTTGGFYFITNNELNFAGLNSTFSNQGKTDILFTSKNEALVSTFKGIYRIENYKGNGNIINIYGEKELSHLSPDFPYSVTYKISTDRDKNIWVQNKEGKIFLITKNKIELINAQADLPKDLATNIYNDNKNNIWLGYFNQGLYKISNDSIRKFTKGEGLNDSHIRSIFEDSKDNIWIGTRYGGVFKYSEGMFNQYSVDDGLSSNWIMTITEDKFGSLWFGTGKGVIKYDGTNWKIYDGTKGIKAGEMSFSATGSNGEVYISSLNGIYSLLPDPEPDTVLPIVMIKKFQFIDGKKINYSNEFTLSDSVLFNMSDETIQSISHEYEFGHNQNSFTFEFASTSLKNEEKNLYSYKLEGFENEWSQLTSRNFINYINLPAGTYKFLVRVKNSDGLWSEYPAEAGFIITPPFWETWWFRIFAFCFLISAVVLITTVINRYRSAQALKIEKMRTKIATDLHDDIGTSLSSIAIFSQLAKRKKSNNEEQLNEYLERIEKTSGNLISAMDDIVWSINPENDSLEDAILKMEDFTVKLFEAKGIDFQIFISNEIKNINLPLEVRRNLLLIFKEIVTNTAKHSNASKVDIAFSVKKINNRSKKISIIVEDNGIGFNPENNYQGNGLKNLKARSEAIQGEIKIDAGKHKGTKYIFALTLED